MKTAFLVVIFSTVSLAGCTQPARETATSVSPATEPSASASAGMDHAAMGHGAPASDSAMNHAMGTSGLKSLRGKTGEAFDRAFLSQMIAHHEAAVRMGEEARGTATKPETKREAQNVMDSQRKEIAQMTNWLKEWYKTAPDAAEQALVNADMKDMMAMKVSSDAVFYAMMIPHHQGAIDMSELALKNAERTEVKDLARKIIAAQKAEIADYQKLMANGI
ncbi:MAG: DUF305 domain-containing protein [Armatimonadetes bacterium]|nr:DUF305 domain-containing protein [Armatimonadota bacterium]